MFDTLREDVDRYVYMGEGPWWWCILTQQALWAIVEYRYYRWARRVRIPLVNFILRGFGFVWHKSVQTITGIDLHHKAEIGKGLYISHFGGIFLASAVKIGEYCNLSQDVAIGWAGRGDKRGCPVIGDRVYIAPGAKIIGPVKIGNDVAIGANAVVTKDLPDSAVAVGVPAKVISSDGSSEFILYRGRKEPEQG
jgi:serine O-acetyltransferase